MIPAALTFDLRIFPGSDGSDTVWLFDECVPRRAASFNDRVIVVIDSIGEIVLS